MRRPSPSPGSARRMYSINSVGAFCSSGDIGPPGAAQINSHRIRREMSRCHRGAIRRETVTASPVSITKPAAAKAFNTVLRPRARPIGQRLNRRRRTPLPLRSEHGGVRGSGRAAKNTNSPRCKPSLSRTLISSPLKTGTAREPPPGTGCRSTPWGRIGRPGVMTPRRRELPGLGVR